MKIGVLIYTHNRTDDARINMEIIRNLWSGNETLKDVTMVHSFNGQKEWWPEKYLEDELLYLDNPGHFAGAEILLNEGMKCFREKYPDIDYIIILASDAWALKPDYIEGIISSMKKDVKYLATCPWGTAEKDSMWKIGMALDFAIIDSKWAHKNNLFPIGYKDFIEKYNEIFLYRDENVYPERVFALRFKQVILNSVKLPSEQLLREVASEYIYRMRDREPVHGEKKFFRIKKGRKMYWPNMGLATHHDPEPKKEILQALGKNIGKYADQLMQSSDLNYYNQGLKQTAFVKGDKKVGYGD